MTCAVVRHTLLIHGVARRPTQCVNFFPLDGEIFGALLSFRTTIRCPQCYDSTRALRHRPFDFPNVLHPELKCRLRVELGQFARLGYEQTFLSHLCGVRLALCVADEPGFARGRDLRQLPYEFHVVFPRQSDVSVSPRDIANRRFIDPGREPFMCLRKRGCGVQRRRYIS